jgi:hypothetical protein
MWFPVFEVNLLKIMARVSEHAYRRGFRHGRESTKKPGQINYGDWHETSLEFSPEPPGFAWGWKLQAENEMMTSLERLLLEVVRSPELKDVFNGDNDK